MCRERSVRVRRLATEVSLRSSSRPIGELDGLRAFAIIAVLIAKLLFNPAVPGTIARAVPGFVRVIGEHCWLGVDLFFVLSGFLITRILLGSRGEATYFRDFWLRRALRILPIYLAVLLVFALSYGIHGYETWYALCLTFATNFTGILGAAHPDGGGPFWSLAVEEQFYLLWPLVVLATPRRVLAAIAIGMLIAEPFARFATVAHFGPNALELAWCRCDGLAAGSLVALWATAADRPRAAYAIACFAGLALAAIAIGGLRSDALGNALRISQIVPLFAIATIVAIAYAGHPALAMLRAPFLRFTAALSFCLYLIHVAVLDAVDSIAIRVPSIAPHLDTPAWVYARFALVVPIAYALATISLRYLERPAIRLRTRFALARPR